MYPYPYSYLLLMPEQINEIEKIRETSIKWGLITSLIIIVAIFLIVI